MQGRLDNHSIDHIDVLQRIESILTRKFKVIHGTDNEEKDYESITEFWCSVLKIQGQQPVGANQSSRSMHDNDMNASKVEAWYQKARTYWNCEANAPATVDGMLGGYSEISDRDIASSRIFVENILVDKRPILNERLITSIHQRNKNGLSSSHELSSSMISRSCECGAGIGRVTKGLLLSLGISFNLAWVEHRSFFF